MISGDTRDFLKRVILFRNVPAAELDKIGKLAVLKEYPKHHVLFREGEAGDVLYIIKSGLVKISMGVNDGRVKTLALLKSGDFFGEMSLLSDEGRSAKAETFSAAALLLISRNNFITLFKKNHSISLGIIRTLIERLAAADRQIKTLALGNARAKIADILLQLAQEFGENKETTKAPLRLTHQELADLAGLARETTTKLLNEFVADEAILLKDHEIEILCKEKLQRWMM